MNSRADNFCGLKRDLLAVSIRPQMEKALSASTDVGRINIKAFTNS